MSSSAEKWFEKTHRTFRSAIETFRLGSIKFHQKDTTVHLHILTVDSLCMVLILVVMSWSNGDSDAHATLFENHSKICAPHTKILAGGTKDEMRVFEVLLDGLRTLFRRLHISSFVVIVASKNCAISGPLLNEDKEHT